MKNILKEKKVLNKWHLFRTYIYNIQKHYITKNIKM